LKNSKDSIKTELLEHRLKRMRMRCWRRGTKEMDLILGHYADVQLALMPEDELEIFEQILNENDQDLLPMILGQTLPPQPFAKLMAKIASHARARLQPSGGYGK
jgi:antitoxin CptB